MTGGEMAGGAEGKIKIAVVFGGRSGEHEISCRSAAGILGHLSTDRYDALAVRIAPDGRWSVDGRPTGTGVWDSMMAAMEVLRDADVVFPALHGPYGEDGTLQSALELLGVPYVGNGVLASAAGMAKDVTKTLLTADGLRVADGVVLGPGGQLAEARQLPLPVYVKPARAGSSLGVSRVEAWEGLGTAVLAARKEDPRVLVEAAVCGREVDLGVLEHPDGRIEVGPPLEILVGERQEFFDYVAKYDDSGTVFQIPADLDPAVRADLSERAVRVFTALGCRGLLRVDFFLPADGSEPVVNEVNTFPGFTAASQFPRIWAAAGIAYPRLLDILIATAMSR